MFFLTVMVDVGIIRAKGVSNSRLRSPRNCVLLEKKQFVCLCVCTL